jgi:hypothetical protein
MAKQEKMTGKLRWHQKKVQECIEWRDVPVVEE